MRSGHSERYDIEPVVGPEGSSTPDPVAVRRPRSTIARRILSQSLALAAIPVLLVGALSIGGLFVLSTNADRNIESARLQLTTETAGRGRAEQAQSTARAAESFVAERLDDVIDWTRANPVTVAASQERPEIADFIGVPTEEVEEAFPADTQLDATRASSDYLLSQIVGQPLYSEVLFTDANGFTVGSTNTPTMFAHQNQRWWREAWESGAYVGPITMSSTNNQLEFEVALRIDLRASGTAIGVMRAVVNATTLQNLAQDQADRSDGVIVQLFSPDGSLLVDTSTDVDLDSSSPVTRQALDRLATSEANSGYVVGGDVIAGYARSTGVIAASQLAYEVPTPQWIAITGQPIATALAPLSNVDQIGDDLHSTIWLQGILVGAVMLATLLIVLILSRRLAARIARPINELREEAIRVADHELPHLVSSLEAGYELDEIAPSAPIEIDADGEVADLASAFTSLQTTATDLAAGQTIGRNRDVAAVLLNLGRRNQQLIGRQLRYIDQLERNESDPDTLKNLFLLDQMATRMRRNAESLLVLAGEDPPRRGTQPRPPEEILRAAISEVEDYARVAIAAAEPANIRPHVVSDLTHLLAELIENATNFSAPETMIHVSGERDPDSSYTISVIDRGIGMSPDRLAQANQRISDPTFSSDASSSFLGLYVVGRLAARHDISVRLVESGSAGIAAVVTLPPDCLVGDMLEPGQPGGYGRHVTAPNPVVAAGGARPNGPITSQTPVVRPPSVLPPSVMPYFAPHRSQQGPPSLPPAGDEPGRPSLPAAQSPTGLGSDPGSDAYEPPVVAELPDQAWAARAASSGAGDADPVDEREGEDIDPQILARPRRRGDDAPTGLDRPTSTDPAPGGSGRPPTVFDDPASSDDGDARVPSQLADLLPDRTRSEGGTPSSEERLDDLASFRSPASPERRDDTGGVPSPPFRSRLAPRAGDESGNGEPPAGNDRSATSRHRVAGQAPTGQAGQQEQLPDDRSGERTGEQPSDGRPSPEPLGGDPSPAAGEPATPGRATFQVKRRVPGRALAESGQAVGATAPARTERPQLDDEGNLPETSMNRAAEVRDKLTRFAIGVGAAKAEKTTDNDDSRTDDGVSDAEGRRP